MVPVLTSEDPSCVSKIAKGLKAHALEHSAQDIHQGHAQQANLLQTAAHTSSTPGTGLPP